MGPREGRHLALATPALLLVWAVLCCVQPVWAQEEYRLQPGDVLHLAVIGEEEYTGDYAVSLFGNLALGDLGAIKVAGATVSEARDLIVTHLKQYLKRPRVSLVLDEEKSRRRIYVWGAVEKPQYVELPLGATVGAAIAAAGGFSAVGVRSAVAVQRVVGEPVMADLSPGKDGLPKDAGLALRSGDVIWVPQSTALITVLGAIQQPGRYPLDPSRETTVLDAVGVYGQGPAKETQLGDATILREGQEPRRVNLRQLLFAGDLTQNVALQAGDVVVVAEAERITVLGQVAAPVKFAPGLKTTVTDALALAQGLTPTSDLRSAAIIRAGQRMPVDLEALWLHGDSTKDVELLPGDVLLIPEADNQIVVVGEVTKQGAFAIKPGTRLLTAINLAEGFTKEADLTRTTVLREGETIIANLKAVLEQGSTELNVPVSPGDVVMVPPMEKAYVLGAVMKPGKYPAGGDRTVLDLLSDAGGPTQQSSPGRIVIARRTVSGQEEIVKFDLRQDAAQADVDPRFRVQPGDIVFVPTKSERRDWSAMRDIFWSASSLALGLLR